MDLSLNPPQELIRDSVRAFVARRVPKAELVRQAKAGDTWDPLWFDDFRAAGWVGALVPESFGGSDLDPLSVALLFEELGRGAVASPLIASSAIAVALLRGCRPSTRRDAALSGVARGTMILIPALRRPETAWHGVAATGTKLAARPPGWRLAAKKVFVPFAAAATHFLVSVTTPEAALAIVPVGPGVSCRLLGGFLQANYEVDFDDIALSETDILPQGERSYDAALAPARIAIAGYQVGGMAELLDLSVAYSNTREQFGRPIGRFQRVQDHIVRLLNAMDTARWLTYEAASALAADRNGVARSYLAAAVASEGYIEAANAAHEVHAAIGSDPQYGLTLYTRMSRTMYELLGPPEWLRLQMADAFAWAA